MQSKYTNEAAKHARGAILKSISLGKCRSTGNLKDFLEMTESKIKPRVSKTYSLPSSPPPSLRPTEILPNPRIVMSVVSAKHL